MERIKYPRIYHLPWSKNKSNDDKVLKNTNHFFNKQVVVLEKRDGENTTIYSDGYFHARSIESSHHPSQSYLKNFCKKYYYNIPKDWRVCGENLYAKHSIHYLYLKEYFEVFTIFDENNVVLSWDDTIEYTHLIFNQDITTPVIYNGFFNQDLIEIAVHNYTKKSIDPIEGYVIRLKDSFNFKDFNKSIAKFVRKDHIRTDKHWTKTWVPNSLKYT